MKAEIRGITFRRLKKKCCHHGCRLQKGNVCVLLEYVKDIYPLKFDYPPCTAKNCPIWAKLERYGTLIYNAEDLK